MGGLTFLLDWNFKKVERSSSNQSMHSAAPCPLFPPRVFIRAQKSEEGAPCFLFLPGKYVYGIHSGVIPSFRLFLHPPRDLRTWLLDSRFFSNLFFFTLDFFSTLFGRCVYGAHRGPCTISTDGEGQRGQLLLLLLAE